MCSGTSEATSPSPTWSELTSADISGKFTGITASTNEISPTTVFALISFAIPLLFLISILTLGVRPRTNSPNAVVTSNSSSQSPWTGAVVRNDTSNPRTSPFTLHFSRVTPLGGITTFFDDLRRPKQSVSPKFLDIKSTTTLMVPTATLPIASCKDVTTASESPEHIAWVMTLKPIIGFANFPLVTTKGTGNLF